MPSSTSTWKVLLVDDDPAILRLGELLLASVSFDGRSVEMLLASSSDEAKQVISANPDLAVAVVDVIMETSTAGLDLAVWLAEQPAHAATRVVIHSGQPAETRQDAVERNYEIHDYWHKSAVNASAMRTRLLFLLRNHRDILRCAAGRQTNPVRHPGDLWSLAYTSTWSGSPDAESIRMLTDLAKEKNAAASITGVLLVDGRRILQILEGPRAEVLALYARIERDDRHYGVERLYSDRIAVRSFSQWSMRAISHESLTPGVATPLLESIRSYAAGHRPTAGNYAQLLLSLVEARRPTDGVSR